MQKVYGFDAHFAKLTAYGWMDRENAVNGVLIRKSAYLFSYVSREDGVVLRFTAASYGAQQSAWVRWFRYTRKV